jgi:predicted nucleic acid-binding protein
MKQYVLDTSVTIAWYMNEAFSDQARRWQRDFHERYVEFLVPKLHLLEFGNVFRGLVTRKLIAVHTAQHIYETHCRSPLRVMEPNTGNLLMTALQYNATIYDASFIQLALEENVPLITAERGTREWVKKLGDQVISVG